jgi:hypothetical protein
MKNLRHKKCKHPGCITVPSFGEEGKSPEYCTLHKDKTKHVDVRSKFCEIEDCETQASYGYEKSRPLRCSGHVEDDMKDVVSAMCKDEKCEFRATCGKKFRGTPEYCSKHALDDYVPVHGKFCDGCSSVMWDRNFAYCAKCREASNFVKYEEITFLEFLKNYEPLKNYNFIYNKSSADNTKNCGNYKPDVLFNLPTHNVIIEVDENEHRYDDPFCEVSRMFKITTGLGIMHTIFVRYNPNYLMEDDTKIRKLQLKDLKEERMKIVLDKTLEYLKLTPEELQKLPILTVDYKYYSFERETELRKLLNRTCD